MIERVLVLFALVALVVVGVLVARAYARARARRLMAVFDTRLWTVLGEAPDGRQTVIQFSTPSCAACHTAQAPAVGRVEQQLGAAAVRVIEVDASERPEVAQAFGVMTVPSTVVLAPSGNVLAVNQGFAPTARLLDQLQSVPAPLQTAQTA
jgi:thiol-disulfide isomerase/thioredoxin